MQFFFSIQIFAKENSSRNNYKYLFYVTTFSDYEVMMSKKRFSLITFNFSLRSSDIDVHSPEINVFSLSVQSCRKSLEIFISAQ